MSTIHLSNYGISITPGKMDAVNREIQQKIQIGEPFELDFDGVEGLDTRAAYALLEPLRKHYGKDYRKYVSFSNVAPMVNNALIFSGTTSPNTVISNPRTPKHSFTSAFSRIFATILLLLTLGVGQMWAWRAPHFYVCGPAIGDADWSSASSSNDWKIASPASPSSESEWSTFVWMEENTWFALNNGTSRYAGNNDVEIKSGSGSGTYGYTSKGFKYTGSTGLVRINAAQTGDGNSYGSQGEYYPYIWVEENLETEILRGNKIMFYFGHKFSEDFVFLSSENNNNRSTSTELYYPIKTISGTNVAVAYVSAANYWITNSQSWSGVQMGSAATAGALYSLSNPGTGNTVSKTNGVIPAFSSSTYNHATGVAVSTISASAGTSTFGNPQEIKYYYTTSSTPGSASFTAFDPSDISGLSAGTYYIYALGWDGHILVRSAAATLTVADAPGISLSIEDGSDNVITAARSGDEITLKATPVNAGVSPNIVFEWSSSSTFASDIHEIANSTDDEVEWTIPAITATTTYYFRARITTAGKVCSSAISSFTGYGKKTIHVRNNNKWAAFKIHHWGSSDINPTTWDAGGASLPACTSDGGQWYSVDIYSCATGFVLTSGADGNQNKTVDLSYGQSNPTLTDGAYYEMSISGSEKQTLSLSSAPAAPTVTLTTTIRQNQISLKGTITAYNRDGTNVDDMQEVGFYIGGVKHVASCDNNGNEFYYTKTGLTANTAYSISAYAVNAGGEGSATATPKTLATTATHKLKVQVPNGVTPYIYTYCDNDACEDNSLQNAAFPGQAATRIIDGVSNDWYEFDIHDQYDKFIISADDKGAKQTANIPNSRTDICRWYNNSPENQEDRYGTTDCPVTETSLYIGDKDAAAASHTYYTMSGTTTMSKTVSLVANHAYEFKVVYNAEYYGIASKTINRDGKTNNVINAGTSSAGADYIYLNTDFAGDYTITFNESTKTITVTYPTAYVVTYSKSIVGTDNSTTAAPSAAYTTGATAVTSGDLVPNGTGVTFTAAAAGSGYTWKGWYTVADPSADYTANRVATTAEYATTISAATTIYAVYAEDMHTVTVTAGAHGSITTPTPPATTSAGVETSASIVASPADGYRFINWTKASGTGTPIFASAESKSTTVTVTGGDVTIQANFASNWVIGGSAAPFTTGDAWDMNHALSFGNFATDGSGDVVGSVDVELPANTEYEVKVYDHKSGLADGVWWGYTESKQTVDYTHNKGTALGFGEGGLYQNLKIVTAGHGTYCFTWNATDHELTVTMPASYTVTYETLTWKGTNGEVKETSTTGGSLTSVVDNDDLAFTSGKYVVASGSVTFTASPATNYSLEGWYSDAECTTAYVNGKGGATITENTLTLSSLTADKTVYAKFQENMTTVTLAHTGNGSIKIGDNEVTSTPVGAVTTRTLVPVAATGYYFAGWTKTACTDYSISGAENSEDNTTITLTGGGTGETSGEILTANFVELDKIYFRNIFDDGEGNVTRWENVYVHFDISWSDYSGKQAVKTSADNSTKGLHVAMTQIGSSDVYWAYVPRYITANSKAKVAFADHEDTYDNSYLWEGMASGRGDYSPLLNMFVPYHSSNETGVNGVNYYSNGYWMKYDTRASQGAGYYLKKYKSQGNYWQPGEFIANTDDATTIQFKVRLDNVTTDSTRFMIVSAGGLNYLAASTPTSTACSDIELNEDTRSTSDNTVYFQLTATSEGYYTFIIDQTGDKMKLTVDYPVSPGDYRLVHTYTGRNIANTADSTYTTYSDVIKGSTATESKTLSMYLNRASTSLVLQKCTEINSTTKLPTWSTGDATNLSAITTAVGTNSGVYQFDVTVDTSTDQVSAVNHIGLYTGNYYIKTDCATGGWVNYTQNAMEKNNATFSSEDASTYDYFYCKWVDSGNGGDGGGTNVKCVIANDYCNAVSDTLEGDAILGGAQVLPKAANVRFSYNSTTNTLKRTYINGATGWESSFLSLKDAQSNFDGSGGAMITHFNGTALTSDTLSFVDMNNWIYQRDLKAKPGSRIRLTANYKYSDKDHEQYLIGQTGDLSSSTTVQIIGGETNEFIPMRAIYDFKTNNLIVGYLASDEEVTKTRALNADVLIVREDQGDAAQITFGNNVHFTEVDTVYGILELKKSSILDENMSIYERALYWISFPFDVKLGDVFGFGEYGKHWMIQYYDGAARAENGFWAEVETYWKWVMPNERANFTLEANKGYLLGLDLDEMTSTSTVWGNNVQSVSLYFPSSGEVGSITWPLTSSKNVVVQTHECTIERDDRWYKDANWNVIGVPSYANWTKTVVAETAVSQSETLVPHNVPFLYRHNTADNTLVAVASSSVEFKSMQAYVVQYAGTIDWTTNAGPFAAPKRTPEQNGERNLTLHLNGDNETADHTFIRFTHEEGITEGLDMNKDLTKEFKPQANIYSLVPGRVSQVQLAANLLPADYTTTTVEVGVRVAQDGYYTFSMPSTDGLTVVLYDRLTETRTNLLIGTYRAELSAGTTNGRFVLEIGNAQAPTAIQSVGNDANGEQVIKFVQDGQLYILKNGRVFNAEGKAIE